MAHKIIQGGDTNIPVDVNGKTLDYDDFPYPIKDGDVIVARVTLEDTALSINGTTYSSSTTISLSDTDITLKYVSGSSINTYDVTINYSESAPKSISLDNLKVFKEELEKVIPPECDTAELNTIYYNIDGTLTDEQLTYLQSFKNLMFLKVKYNEISASTIDIFLSKVRTVGTSQIVFTFNHSTGTMNIGYAASSLTINLSNKTYKWTTTSVGVITDHNIHYDVNGTLSSSTLAAMKEFANSGGNLLLHLIIGGVSSIGYDYLTYTSHEIAGKTKITFISDGYKKIVINLTDGTYTFEVSQVETFPITQDDYDNLETKDSNILYVIKE